MQKTVIPLDQSQLHGLGAVMGFFCVSFGLIAVYSWYTEAPFLIPRIFPIVAFLVSLWLGYRVWKFFSLEYVKIGHVPFAKFISAVCLPLVILSAADIFDQFAQSFVWEKGVAIVEKVERVALPLRRGRRGTTMEVTYQYELGGSRYARTERMKSVLLREVNEWNASSTLTEVGGSIEWSYSASGSLAFGSRMSTDWKGRSIAVRVHPSHPERVFAEQPTRYFSYLLLTLSILGWVRYGQKEKPYV